MPRSARPSVDDYIAAQPEPARQMLERVRAVIRKALPGATEGISYQIPVYKLDGRMVLYFAGFRRHYSIYPATSRVVEALDAELAGRVHSKATIRFPFGEAVPARLIARIAKLRAAEVAGLDRARDAKRPAPRKARSNPRAKPAKQRARKS
jgi:uncharacterized protein YdhG (YjbR/CyaY superfamily)